jgi:enoyl-CoA hydratase/carnithine racemase
VGSKHTRQTPEAFSERDDTVGPHTKHEGSAVGEHDDLVLRSDAEGVCTLTLNNPERRNAWTVPLENRYFDLLDEADADEAVRAIVLTASGRTFCPGLDSGRLTEIAATTVGPKLDRAGRRPQTYPLSIRKPIIGAINGSAAGMGLMQALNTDVRFCSSKARFSTAYAKRGLPAEYGSSWILPRVVGLENALDLLLSSRIIDAAEAKAMGLVSRVLEPDEVLPHAQRYAAELASICSPASMAAIRQQIYGDLSRSLDEAIDQAQALLEPLLEGEDFAEGVASFLEERPASFPPLGPRP